MSWLLQIEIVMTALAAATLAVAGLAWLDRRARRAPVSVFAEDTSATVFLFDGDSLIDSTPGARALLAAIPAQGTHWARLMTWATPHFEDLEARLMRLPYDGALTLTEARADGQALMLQAEMRGGLTRVVLTDPSHQVPSGGQDAMALRAMEDELGTLREAAAKSPVLAWREKVNGDVTWANAAYMVRAGEMLSADQDLAWPLPRVFSAEGTNKGADRGVVGERHRLQLPGGEVAWYDVVCQDDNRGRLCFATPIDKLVTAEDVLRDFMIALTKTFAHLPVGLAVFDKNRQLILFNPALMDLTSLGADFLTMRPSLPSFIDALREKNMIPEPKDYHHWRRQITQMERAAADDVYQETWSLPGGQTYRVIGRPHPNGALALMIEDISSEMIRTRRFRAEIELGHSVLDQMEEAVAVFSPAGQLAMANDAYTALWGDVPGANPAEATLRSLSLVWRNRCAPTPLWSDLEDFAAQTGERKAWNAELRLNDGRMIDARFLPLAGGATMTGFRLRDAAETPKAVFVQGGGELKRA